MSHFPRKGYWRLSKFGNRHWVSGHSVSRYEWDRAESFRQRISARRFELEKAGRTRCFVIPNAKCPVCGMEVYYYQNQVGSRVFFDELGWPWPKHSCTDVSRFRILRASLQARSADDRDRALNEMHSVDLDLDRSFAEKFGQLPWRLIRIIRLFRNGTLNLAVVESLEQSRRSSFQFESRRRDLKKGDIVARKGMNVTFVDHVSLEPRKIKVRTIRKLREFIDALPSA